MSNSSQSYQLLWAAAAAPQVDDTLIGKFNVSQRARISSVIRAHLASEAQKDGNDNTLWITAQSSFSATSHRWTRSNTHPIISIEYDLHDLWHLYYAASMNTHFQRPEQDRLVTQILFVRELGTLKRRGEEGEVIEEAVTGDGRIFADLPYLAVDMMKYWVEEHVKIEEGQRQNLSAFLAKLCSVGVLADRLSGIALVLFRDTLETIRPVGEALLGPGDLLRSVDMWLYHAGDKIIDLSERTVNEFPQEVGELGELAKTAGVPHNGGFSIQRWIFWVKRLEELQRETKEVDEELSEKFEMSVNGMKTTASRIDSLLWRELVQQGLSEYRVYDVTELKGKKWI